MQAFGLQDQLIDNEKILVFALIKQQIFHVSLKRRKIKKNGEYGRNQRDLSGRNFRVVWKVI